MVRVIENPPSSSERFISFFKKKSSYSFLILLFLVVATLLTFKQLHLIQDLRQQAAYDPSTHTFLATFDGNPASPTKWSDVSELENFDVAIHSRDQGTWQNLEEMDADHGTDCAASTDNSLFPQHHIAGSYPDSIFLCKNHIMTSIKAGGYGEIILTPAARADWSNGTATISVDVSTYRSSGRDWWGLTISPYEENLVLPLENWLPDLDGYPKNAIHFVTDGGSGTIKAEQIADGTENDVSDIWWIGLDNLGIPQSKANRSHYVWTISKTHITAGIETPATNGACPTTDWNLINSTCTFNWVNKDLPTPLTWNQGIVQFEHHSYNPEKDCNVANPPSQAGTCKAGTWHWDNFKITPSEPFTVIKGSPVRLEGSNTETVTANFPTPAPANSYLRFAAVCRVDISLNNGVFQQASNMATTKHAAGDFDTNQGTDHSYFIPVPQGTNQVAFKFHPDGWYTNWPCLVEDPALWSSSVNAGVPTGTVPSPTNTPSIQPTSSLTPSAAATPTTIPIAVKSSIIDGSTLTGNVMWKADTTGFDISKVDFLIDGVLKWTENTAPYQFNGDPDGVLETTLLTNGSHTFMVKATSSSGAVSSSSSTVTVSNISTTPTSSPTPIPSFTSSAAGPSTVITGNSFTINSTVTSSTSFTGNVIVSLFDPNGVQKATQQYSSQNFSAGQAKSYSIPWQLPTNSATGLYTVKIQITDSTNTLFHYNSNALTFVVEAPTPTPIPTVVPTAGSWKGEYFNNRNLSGTPVLIRNDPAINFNWGLSSPASNIPVDNFSVRWTKQEVFTGGAYTFTVSNDDGMIISVDGSVIYNNWKDQGARARRFNAGISAGSHIMTVLYYEHGGYAVSKVSWKKR